MPHVFIWSFDYSQFVLVQHNPPGAQQLIFALGYLTFKSSHVHTYKLVPFDFTDSSLFKSMVAFIRYITQLSDQWPWMIMTQKLSKES